MTLRFEQCLSKFSQIPNTPIAYWLSDKMCNVFKGKKVGSIAFSDGQTKTGDNDKYLRFLWEVNNNAVGKNKKWVIHVKGGVFRRWYGNIDTVINWSVEARKHYKEDKIARIAPEYIWFRKGVCWNLITSSEKFAVRFLDDDSTFNLAAPSIFFNDDETMFFVLGLLNSIVAEKIIRMLNPTLNTNIGDVMAQPLIIERKEEVVALTQKSIYEAQNDWNSFETSWEFRRHPLI